MRSSDSRRSRRSRTRIGWAAGTGAALPGIALSAVFACSSGTPFGETGPADPDAAVEHDTSSTDDGAAVDTGDATDASPDHVADAGGRDAHFALACGTQVCADAGTACCSDPTMSPPAGYSCASATDFCAMGESRLICDDDDDCAALGNPGTVCCAALASNGTTYFVATTTCALAANCVGAKELQLCDRTVAGECPSGTACVDVTTYPTDGGADLPVRAPVSACQP